MDANHHKFSNPTWELEMAMENQILHDHDKVPLGALWPNNYNPLHQDHHPISSVLLNQLPSSSDFNMGEINNNHQFEEQDPEEEELGTMKEMMFKIAAMQPVNIDPTTIRKPKRRNVRISDDPQSVAARHRRERISEKMRILQRLVPGGTKMDSASMLEEAGRYIKFLKRQIRQLQANHQPNCVGVMDCLSAGEWLVAANKPLGGSTGSSSMEPVAGCTLGSDGAAPAGGHEHLSCNDHEVIN